MNNNIIIEASQKNSIANDEIFINNNNITVIPGQYKINLAKPVFVNDGDSVIINKCFIDTESEIDGIIRIEHDLNIEIDTMLYLTNDRLPGPDENSTPDKISQYRDGNITNDNYDYYLYENVSQSGAVLSDFEVITEFEFDADNTGGAIMAGDPSNAYSPPQTLYPVGFNYIGLDNKKHFWAFDIPQFNQEKASNNDIHLTTGIHIVAKKDPTAHQGTTLTSNNEDGNWDTNVLLSNPATCGSDDCRGWSIGARADVKSTIDRLNVKTFTKSFVIPKDDYTPQQLVDLINNKLTSSFTSNIFKQSDALEDNPFLKSSNSYLDFVNDGSSFVSTGYRLVSQSERADPSGVLTPRSLVPNELIYIGTNQVELAYDETDNRFYWNYMHFPVYDGQSTEKEITKIIAQKNSTNLFVQAKNGGFAFSDLRATYVSVDSDFTPYDFWTGKLGFIKKKLIPVPSDSEFNDETADVTATVYTSINGLTTTSARSTLDAFVQKDAQYYKVPGITAEPKQPSGRAYTGVESNLNTVVKADFSTLNGELLNSGFFYVELDTIMQNELVSEGEVTQTISAIVDRYNSKGSYTSSTADGSFQYIHYGETACLSSIGVRILNSDREPADVGIDNTIFLEVIRGQGQQPQPPET